VASQEIVQDSASVAQDCLLLFQASDHLSHVIATMVSITATVSFVTDDPGKEEADSWIRKRPKMEFQQK